MLTRVSASMMAAAVFSVATLSQAAPTLTYDVRIASASTNVTVTDNKDATVSAVGDVIHLQLYGLLNDGNGNANDDGISSAGGSALSATGGLLGNIANGGVSSTFQGTGYSVGTSQDLDGDGDNDLGSTSTSSNTAYFKAVTNNGINPVAGDALLLGTFDFTVTSLGSGSTTINFLPSTLISGVVGTRNYHIFTVDGTGHTDSAFGTNSDGSIVARGTSVNIVTGTSTPEPTSLALLGLGATGLIRRRRVTA